MLFLHAGGVTADEAYETSLDTIARNARFHSPMCVCALILYVARDNKLFSNDIIRSKIRLPLCSFGHI